MNHRLLIVLLSSMTAAFLVGLACDSGSYSGPTGPPSPTDLEAAWQICESAVDEGIRNRDLAAAEQSLSRYSAMVEAAATSGTADPGALLVARERLDRGRRRLAEARERVKVEEISAQVDEYLSQGSFNQARFYLELYLNSGHPSPWAENQVAGLQQRIDQEEARNVTPTPHPPRATPTPAAPDVHGLRFAYIPEGTYRVGSPPGEQGRDGLWDLEPVSVRLRGYFISTTEVTQEAFIVVRPRAWAKYAHQRRPAHSVSFGEAEEFCDRLTAQHPGYSFSLPSELEWEVACRAGRGPEAGPVGVDVNEMDRFRRGIDSAAQALQRYAVFQPNHLNPGPSAVAQKEPNPIGLYDMHGNVAEWCRRAEQISSSYTNLLHKQPTRGGSVLSEYARCRAGARAFEPEGTKKPTIGFRVICRRL